MASLRVDDASFEALVSGCVGRFSDDRKQGHIRMQWAWATSLDELWRSPSFPMWVTLIAAGFSALVVLIVLLRADKTMANGALAVIALLAIGIASTTTVRGFGTPSRVTDTAVDPRGPATQHVALAPALACLDGLAGESVEAACEKAVFGSADTAAAAVSYTAGQVSRVIAAGSARTLTPEQQILKRSVERDRYGLVAQVVMIRDRCVVTDCPLFRALSDTNQIKANMNERLYDTLVVRYSSAWTNAAAAPSPAAGLLAGAPASGNTPTGRPSTVDYATSSAIPPVSIMTPDPPAQAAAKSTNAQPAAAASAPAAAAKSSTGSQGATASAPATAAKSSNGQQGAAASAPSPKSTNAQAQAKRAPAAQSASQGQSQQPGSSITRPRVVAPVPYVPSQVGDEQ
jgi:hypothetical protein